MSVTFDLLIKPFSINKASYRDARFKTTEYKDWHAQMMFAIQENESYKSLLEIAEDHKTHGGVFFIKIECLYPNHVFFNKSGQISAKTIDVTNTEKLIVDVFFRDIMQVDDRFLIKCISSKKNSHTYGIRVSIEHFK